jgi:hypothetical protein
VVSILLLEVIFAAMQVPFPALLHLPFFPNVKRCRLLLSIGSWVNLPHIFDRFQGFLHCFELPQSYLDRRSRRLPLPTCSILLALTQFEFRGVSKYLEDFVAKIDRLYSTSYVICIIFFHQLIFDTPHLAHFIIREGAPDINVDIT